ncbi:enoyl-CoA hydratase domain-containing protein 3, mitochondrial-like [Eupeodes corollae]|uniref:enoyl-CoA hydratase domain-containing protein 3, mitochondrial-like n=1 Tax=Eupeodes corollae TaxID=290404 RepID=UPI002493AC72|nr:enoyl-CoA hydratase domain-containing protein 3, mitochondrial-like [Eupeodes corollae]
MMSYISRNSSLARILHSVRFVNTSSSKSPVENDVLTIVSENNGVLKIQLNRPKTRNPLSMAIMESILNGITKNVSDEALRCIVISSTGPVYSAGHNLNKLKPEKGPDCQREVFDKCAELIHKIPKAPVLIIAKVDVLAAAAGFVMPRMKSSYMLFTGFSISAKDAYISGLVSAVC